MTWIARSTSSSETSRCSAARNTPGQLRRPGEHRSERAAEPLREADRDRVGEAPPRRRREAGRDGRVEEPGAVEMHGGPALSGRGGGRAELVERPDPRTRAAVRIL